MREDTIIRGCAILLAQPDATHQCVPALDVGVAMVAHYYSVHMFRIVRLNLSKQTRNCIETILICDVINNNDTCIRWLNVRPGAQDDCVATVCPTPAGRSSHIAEALLPSAVPLQNTQHSTKEGTRYAV